MHCILQIAGAFAHNQVKRANPSIGAGGRAMVARCQDRVGLVLARSTASLARTLLRPRHDGPPRAGAPPFPTANTTLGWHARQPRSPPRSTRAETIGIESWPLQTLQLRAPCAIAHLR